MDCVFGPALLMAGVTIGYAVNSAMSQSKCNVLQVAQEFIAKRYPSFDPTGLTPVVSEGGSVWEVTYNLPAGMLGGVPIVVVDKRTCKVVRAQHSQ